MEESTNCKETFEIKVEIDSENRKILNEYLFLKTLGKGSFSKVKLARNTIDNKEYAVKIINKRVLERQNKSFTKDADGNVIITNSLQDALREMAILKKLNHHNIIKLYEIIHDVECGKIYMVTEVAEKGNLLNYDEFTGEFSLNPNLIEGEQKYYSEDQIRKLFRDIILGLDYLHASSVVHRDIKPDNILINAEGVCKITDFNVSVMLEKKQTDQLTNTKGTAFFYAPEMCQKDNPDQSFAGKPLDIWALGVTLYIMTFNKLPIRGEDDGNMMELLDLISDAKITFPESDEREISAELKELISTMLEKDPSKRATTEQIKRNNWINLGLPDLSKEVYKAVEVTEEEIKNSLKFFFTLRKTKHIAKEFKSKITQLSLKRKEVKKKESIVLKDPRFIKEAEEARDKKKINQTEENLTENSQNTENLKSEGNEASINTVTTEENKVKETTEIENKETEPITSNDRRPHEIEVSNRVETVVEQTEDEKVKESKEINTEEGEIKEKEVYNIVTVSDENKDKVNSKENEPEQEITRENNIRNKEEIREPNSEIKGSNDSVPNSDQPNNDQLYQINEMDNTEKEVKTEKEIMSESGSNVNKGNEDINKNDQKLKTDIIENQGISNENTDKKLIQNEQVVATNVPSTSEKQSNQPSQQNNDKEKIVTEEPLSIIDKPTIQRKQLNQETREFSSKLSEDENKKTQEKVNTPAPVEERKCCILF